VNARPRAVLRAPLGGWGAALGVAFGAIVIGSIPLLLDGVLVGTARIAVWLVVLAAFAGVVASVTMVTLRWRTSLRSDGKALVLRGPLGAVVIPFHDALVIGRWLDERQRPQLWVLDGARLLAPVSGRLGSARVEAFAHVIDLPVIDHLGLPPDPDDSELLDPYPPESPS
jgi:hypothetical protein